MVVLVALFYIYCIIGTLIGFIQMWAGNWPKYTVHEDTVGGLASFKTVDLEYSLYFFLLCGPLFWVCYGFYKFFSWVSSLVEEDKDDDKGPK